MNKNGFQSAHYQRDFDARQGNLTQDRGRARRPKDGDNATKLRKRARDGHDHAAHDDQGHAHGGHEAHDCSGHGHEHGGHSSPRSASRDAHSHAHGHSHRRSGGNGGNNLGKSTFGSIEGMVRSFSWPRAQRSRVE
eukprot:1178578-Prorocentrum_minimum.AAC.5